MSELIYVVQNRVPELDRRSQAPTGM